ncbi:glycoside hydrolase family 35 protein [Spelaeicoccus albus]|uniref:Beta-galactosidase n=1 Tax=Spelaeicoccus albus TaxID=1280376 RepID=A0A7Z0A8D0_9MICO|nr:beta-galactosidase family protein [Spelaeicoccus albus]NYI66299.1 beta-galactosidase [Spelaeicoccus albus]
MGENNALNPRALTYRDASLYRFDRPHTIRSGALHYFRVHPGYWADRLARAKAMGLNTIDTYIPWNFHQQYRGEPDFSGPRDLERFIGLAADAGLDVMVRPGPYICAEWDNGGLPSWVTGIPGIRLRSSDERFTTPVAEWLSHLLPRLAPLQASAGGPIVAVQLENEYGSYGDDHEYLRWLADTFRSGGITELLYTADGPTELMLDGGSVPGVLTAATFGSQPSTAAALLRSRRADEPFLCAEFWDGWFDHWGERHHVRSAESGAQSLDDILAEGSVSIYMAHGGTNFGLRAGANFDDFQLQPTITSYDSDAPISENGAVTDKFFSFRKVLTQHAQEDFPEPPPVPPTLPEESLPITFRRELLPALRNVAPAVEFPAPQTFEEVGLDAGLMLYRAAPVVPDGKHVLEFPRLHDRAQVYSDGRLAGTVHRLGSGDGLAIEGTGDELSLEILVENLGRINYGPKLGEHKGIIDGVLIDRRLVMGWSMVPVPLDELTPDALGANGPALDMPDRSDDVPETSLRADAGATWPAGATAAGAAGVAGVAGVATAELTIDEPADTFLAFPGFGKGFVWIGDFLLGRYWHVGPQRTLYVPAPLLHAGTNRITVLELERIGERIELASDAELGPHEEYIETI